MIWWWDEHILHLKCKKVPLQNEEELYSHMATGWKVLLWCSLLHLKATSLLQRVLWWSIKEACMGWEGLSIIRTMKLLHPSPLRRLRQSLTLRTEPALLISCWPSPHCPSTQLQKTPSSLPQSDRTWSTRSYRYWRTRVSSVGRWLSSQTSPVCCLCLL